RTTTATKAAAASSALRDSSRSNESWTRTAAGAAGSGLVDDTALGDVQARELGVGIAQLHVDRALGRRPAAADLAGIIFEAVWQVDPGAMLVAGDRVAD